MPISVRGVLCWRCKPPDRICRPRGRPAPAPAASTSPTPTCSNSPAASPWPSPSACGLPPPPDPPLRVGDNLGGWVVIQLLGSGGWGQVVETRKDDQVAALKVLPPAC